MEKFYTFIPSLRLDNEGKNREINDKRRYIFKILLKQLIENNIVPVVCAQNYQDEDYLFPDKVIYFNEPKISVNYARNKLFEK